MVKNLDKHNYNLSVHYLFIVFGWAYAGLPKGRTMDIFQEG